MDSTTVKVNVGGTVFTTTRSTIQKAKYFSELALEPDMSSQVIDRCPRVFEYLLNCLRDRHYIKLEKLQEYQPDIDYFAMDCLKAEALKRLPIITVDADSKFKIVLFGGVPILKTKIDFNGVDGMLSGITVTLPYDGRMEMLTMDQVKVPSQLFLFKKDKPNTFGVIMNPGSLQADRCLALLHFYPDHPTAEIRQS
jgi:hypothetical protein